MDVVSAPPPPRHTNPLARIAHDLRRERAATVPFPPGETRPSLTRTLRFAREPLPILLDLYERYGPVFSLRIFHGQAVWALGPEANHHILVANAANFSWREGYYGDLMPLLGDGMLTIDGEFHRRSRKVMLPAFSKQKIDLARQVMAEEVSAAVDRLRDGMTFDLYAWTRRLALRVAMRALLGLDPDRAYSRTDPARDFEQALSFWSKDYVVQMLRGPGTPWRKLMRARDRLDALIEDELRRRRERGEHGDDLLGVMLDVQAAQEDVGLRLTDKDIRDEVMTLMFAGHDTTTSTVAFLFHELGRHPELVEDPSFDLSLALDETLRLYPPAWIGPRRSIEPCEIAGVPVPGGVPVNYSSWASHRLPDVWEEPEEFRPERFAPENRARLPKGAYVPFGGGSRTCLGMRFGQAEITVIATALLERFRLDPVPGYELRTRQMPTIGPRDGLPVTVRAASPAPGLDARAAARA